MFSKTALIGRTLWYFRAAHLAIFAGVALGAAVLTGSLLVGDSLRGSLTSLAARRLGPVTHVLAASGLFQETLAARLHAQPEVRERFQSIEALLTANGSGVNTETGASAVHLTVLARANVPRGTCTIGEETARQLGAAPGDMLALRLDARRTVPAEAALGAAHSEIAALRLKVSAIVAEGTFEGAFSLHASQRPVRNVWMNLAELQQTLDAGAAASLLLASARNENDAADALTVLQSALEKSAIPEDYGLRITRAPGFVLVESAHLYFGERVESALQKLGTPAAGVLAHLANSITDTRTGQSIPYSMAAGASAASGLALAEDEIALNAWAAEALGARIGDAVKLAYFVRDERGLLAERTAEFSLKSVLPMQGLGADRSLVPPFKGVTDAASVAQWNPPRDFPFDFKRVQPRDEEYWHQFGPSPKAILALPAAQRLFATRFGRLTSLRFAGADETAVRAALREHLPPAQTGMAFRSIRAEQLQAASGGTDFGMLFTGFSFFLIISAALLVALLLRLLVEQRSRQIALLLALGFRLQSIRRLLLAESLVNMLLASAAGALAAPALALLMLWGLRTLWFDAIGTTQTGLCVNPGTLLAGAFSSALIAAAAIWKGIGRLDSAGISPLLGSAARFTPPPARKRMQSLRLAVAAAAGAALLTALAAGGTLSAAPAFFGAGALFLAGGLFALRFLFATPANTSHAGTLTLFRFALRNAGRNAARSILTTGLLAAAAFTALAASAMKETPLAEGGLHSGTGGLGLLCELDIPVLHNLGSAEGRRLLALDAPEDLCARSEWLCLRASLGEDASCRNATLPREPQLLAVTPQFIQRNGFSFAATARPAGHPWELLGDAPASGAIPVFADAETAEWILHKPLGGTIPIRDEFGQTRQLQLAGLLKKSIFQSELLVSSANFQKLFPSQTGFNRIFAAAPAEDIPKLRQSLARALADFGVSIETPAERLASYALIANTYISAFQALGALGILLGALGLIVVTVRGALERRAEFALQEALGFTRGALARLLTLENGALVFCGVMLGTLSGLLAAAPAFVRGRGQLHGLLLACAGFCAVILLVLTLLHLTSRRLMARLTPAALRHE